MPFKFPGSNEDALAQRTHSIKKDMKIGRPTTWAIRRLNHRGEVLEEVTTKYHREVNKLQMRWKREEWDLRLSHPELYDE
ncbi:hypothetical protein [Bradyrhizobium sp. 23AC]